MCFKNDFCFDNMADLRETVIDECADIRFQMSREHRMDEQLFTTKWGQLLVVDDDGRLERFGFCDAIHIKGNIPTKKEIKALYDEVLETGATDFKIVFDVLIRMWDTWEDKWAGHPAEPTCDCLEVELVISK